MPKTTLKGTTQPVAGVTDDVILAQASGQVTLSSAAMTVATGLSTAPAAGSIIIKAWMPTNSTTTTPIAATGFAGIKVNWTAVGT